MANVDVNLLASMGFVVKNDGGGNTITLKVGCEYSPGSDWPSTPNIQTGWKDIDFSMWATMMALAAGAPTDTNTTTTMFATLPIPESVSPAVGEMAKCGETPNTLKFMDDNAAGVYNFLRFVNQNPVHVTGLNIRASSIASIPSQIIVLTPDISTGQMTRQLIDVASKKNAYQYQNDIITIKDLDFYLCRNSVIRFNSSFTASITGATGDGSGATSPVPLYIDIIVDRYISLEKALVENVKLLNTAMGQADAINAEINKANAKANPTTLTLNTETQWKEPIYATPSIPTFGNVQSKSLR